MTLRQRRALRTLRAAADALGGGRPVDYHPAVDAALAGGVAWQELVALAPEASRPAVLARVLRATARVEEELAAAVAGAEPRFGRGPGRHWDQQLQAEVAELGGPLSPEAAEVFVACRSRLLVTTVAAEIGAGRLNADPGLCQRVAAAGGPLAAGAVIRVGGPELARAVVARAAQRDWPGASLAPALGYPGVDLGGDVLWLARRGDWGHTRLLLGGGGALMPPGAGAALAVDSGKAFRVTCAETSHAVALSGAERRRALYGSAEDVPARLLAGLVADTAARGEVPGALAEAFWAYPGMGARGGGWAGEAVAALTARWPVGQVEMMAALAGEWEGSLGQLAEAVRAVQAPAGGS